MGLHVGDSHIIASQKENLTKTYSTAQMQLGACMWVTE